MLTQIKFASGVDKQDTTVGAEGRWVDSDNVRFRYGLPEKVGGWQSLLPQSIVGVTRKLLDFVDNDGNRYVAVGTDKFLLIYFEGGLYDITPFRTDANGAQITFTSSTITTNNTAPGTSITITTTTDHGLIEGDMLILDSITMPTGSTGIPASTFEDKVAQVISTPSPTTFTLTSPTAETAGGGANLTTGSSCIVQPYQFIGPAEQTYGYGFGVGPFGGTVAGASTTTINNAGVLAAGATSVILTDSSVMPTTGTLLINNELMTYTTNTIGTNTISGISRAAGGTTDVEHANGSIVNNATDFAGWGNAVEANTVTLEPGLWSLDNFGEVLIATIANGKTFSWNADVAARLTTRASQLTTNFKTNLNPAQSRLTLVSPTTRHLIHFGTTDSTGIQDDMFIKFSNNEQINVYDVLATNTAGTFRLQDGTRIVGALVAKETILVWTDNALYTMSFVGAPFTFGFEQVGTNCGLIGKNAAVEIDGIAYWMSNNGFFAFDGTVKTLPCAVEDFVFDDVDTTKGQQINAGLNNLFTEVTWWYPSQGSDFNNRSVVYNYGQEIPRVLEGPLAFSQPMGNWYTNVNINSIRTAWVDSLIYPRPYATSYNSTGTGTFPPVVGLTGLGNAVLFEHETGTDQINADGSTTPLTSFIQSYNFSLDPKSSEVFLAMRRFLPNFKNLIGTSLVTVGVSDWPADAASNSTYSPFSVSPTTQYIDTRARGRYANIKIENINANESWRFGTFQVDIQPDGRR
tara:strand:- start:150 stop:2384 length:2235 start_codon:yes stop_codon:yes gene_type:complete